MNKLIDIDLETLEELHSIVSELETSVSAVKNLALSLAVRPYGYTEASVLSQDKNLTYEENAFNWIDEYYDLCSSANGAMLALTEHAAARLAEFALTLSVAKIKKTENRK